MDRIRLNAQHLLINSAVRHLVVLHLADNRLVMAE